VIRRARWALGHWLTRDEPHHTVTLSIDGRTIAHASLR
jgi:hypothetical protein